MKSAPLPRETRARAAGNKTPDLRQADPRSLSEAQLFRRFRALTQALNKEQHEPRDQQERGRKERLAKKLVKLLFEDFADSRERKRAHNDEQRHTFVRSRKAVCEPVKKPATSLP
jgi:hypothetical protein